MNGECRSVGVFLRGNPFRNTGSVLRPERVVRLSSPCNDTITLTEVALDILDNIFIEGAAFKRAGVWLGDIRKCVVRPGSLFETEVDTKTEKKQLINKFMKTIDKINNVVGHKNIGLASQIVKGHQGHNDGYSSSFQAPSRKK